MSFHKYNCVIDKHFVLKFYDEDRWDKEKVINKFKSIFDNIQLIKNYTWYLDHDKKKIGYHINGTYSTYNQQYLYNNYTRAGPLKDKSVYLWTMDKNDGTAKDGTDARWLNYCKLRSAQLVDHSTVTDSSKSSPQKIKVITTVQF